MCVIVYYKFPYAHDCLEVNRIFMKRSTHIVIIIKFYIWETIKNRNFDIKHADWHGK